MPFAWGETKPGDSDIVSQHPADERSTRAVVKAFADVEHDQAEGRHKFGIGSTAARDAITTWVDGSIWFNTTDARWRLNFRSVGVWQNAAEEFVAGTVLVFRQASAPIGWTQQVDVTDRVLRIVSGAGGGSGGAWAISGLSSVNDSHGHGVTGTTGNESNQHVHGVIGTTSVKDGGTSQGTSASGGASTPLDNHTHSINIASGVENAGHTHSMSFLSGTPSLAHSHSGDGTWRPAYADVIACIKD